MLATCDVLARAIIMRRQGSRMDVEDEEEACSTSNEPSARSEEDAAWAP